MSDPSQQKGTWTGCPSGSLCLRIFSNLSTKCIISLSFQSLGFNQRTHSKEKKTVVSKKTSECVDRTWPHPQGSFKSLFMYYFKAPITSQMSSYQLIHLLGHPPRGTSSSRRNLTSAVKGREQSTVTVGLKAVFCPALCGGMSGPHSFVALVLGLNKVMEGSRQCDSPHTRASRFHEQL